MRDETKGLRDIAASFPFEPACARFSFNVNERKDRWAAEKRASDRRLTLPSPDEAFAPVFSIPFFLLTWILKTGYIRTHQAAFSLLHSRF